MKTLLLHAIPPESHQPQQDWRDFLRAAAFIPLPMGAEQIAQNVWLIPNDRKTDVPFSRLGHQNATALRVLPFSPASSWHICFTRDAASVRNRIAARVPARADRPENPVNPRK
jgi:hypothetical protein